jgi:hypothetical protein
MDVRALTVTFLKRFLVSLCLRVFGFAPRWATPMVNETEKRFREAERQLDELLRRDEAIIAARGITIADWSGRKYHYKNEHLSWSYWFETRRARGSEIENVLVAVSLNEHEASTVRVGRSAEIFQIGKLPRWSSGTEELLPLEEMVHRGLANIVLEAIHAGEREVADAT